MYIVEHTLHVVNDDRRQDSVPRERTQFISHLELFFKLQLNCSTNVCHTICCETMLKGSIDLFNTRPVIPLKIYTRLQLRGVAAVNAVSYLSRKAFVELDDKVCIIEPSQENHLQTVQLDFVCCPSNSQYKKTRAPCPAPFVTNQYNLAQINHGIRDRQIEICAKHLVTPDKR